MCSPGYFQDEFSCRACNPTCATCEQYSKCTTCSKGFLFNSTTELCESPECTSGEFYSDSAEACISCGSSCSSQCAYRMECLTCASGQSLDLDSFACVNECDTMKITMNDPKLGGLPICRGYDFYVNPLSSSTTELGTADHPYKELHTVFLELLYFHSHSDKEFVIKLFEDTTNYVIEGTYLINISNLRIESYSVNQDKISKAKVVAIESVSTKPPSLIPSKLILLDSSTIDYVSKISSDADISAEDKALLLDSADGILYVYKSNLRMDNVYLSTEYASVNIFKNFINPINAGNNVISITNTISLHEGGFLSTSQQMSLEITDSEFDLYKSRGGFNLHLSCIQGQSSLLILTNISNTKFYFSQDPSLNLNVNFPPFMQYGGHDISFKNVTLMFFGSSDSNGYNFALMPDQTCDTSEVGSRNINFTDIRIAKDSSWLFEQQNMRFGLLFSASSSNSQVLKINIDNIEISDTEVKNLVPLRIEGNGIFECKIHGSTFSNLLTSVEMIRISGCKDPEIHNTTFTNVTMSQSGLVNFQSINSGIFNQTVLQGIQFKGAFASNLMSFINSGSEKLQITSFTYSNGTMQNSKTLIYLENPYGDTFVDTVDIQNVSSSASSSYIKILSSKSSTLNTLKFTDCSPLISSDVSSILVNMREIASPVDSNITFNSISVVNSQLNVIWISNVDQSKTINQYITINDLVITDITFSFTPLLLAMENIISDATFSLKFYRLMIENISNQDTSSLMVFGHQIEQFVEIHDSVFRNISQAGLDILVQDKSRLIPTKILLNNVTVDSWYGNYFSFMGSLSLSEVHVTGSKFLRMSSSFGGPVFYTELSGSKFIISDSLFYQNHAPQGGIFYIDSRALLRCTRCNMTDNFGITNSIAYLGVGGYFEFYDSDIINNHALSVPIVELSLAENKSILNHCRLRNNTILTEEYIKTSVLSQDHIHPDIREYILATPYLFSINIQNSAILAITGELDVTNQTVFSYQHTIIRAIDSFILLDEVSILDMNIESDCVISVQSDITLSNISLTNMSSQGDYYFLNSQDSTIRLNSANFSSSSVGLITSLSSILKVANLEVKEIKNVLNILKILTSEDLTLESSKFEHISPNENLINVYKSSVSRLKDILISNVSNVAIHVRQSTINSLQNITSINCLIGAHIEESLIQSWTNSVFENCGNSNIELGGAIMIRRSNTTIQNSVFTNNEAQNGAAIAIDCDTSFHCNNKLSGNIFDSNNAKTQGGGIYYNMDRPVMDGLVFANNNASYGNNIASYAYDIIFTNSQTNRAKADSIGSAILLEETYEVRIVDYDNQTINLINTGVVNIGSSFSNTSVGGIDRAKIVEGVANLTNFSFIAPPGSQNITYLVTSSHIDYGKIAYLSSTMSTPEKARFIINLRYCKPGEMQIEENKCRECSFGGYSLNWSSILCESCMPNADCLGSDHISVDKGYWRKTEQSDHIVACFREKSCLGGYHPENENPVKCEKGYEGLLCSKCSITDESKYQPSGNFECLKCPSRILNAVEVVIFQLIALAFIYFIIIINIRKKSENQFSILLRIFTNYTQLITVIMSFNIKFPNIFNEISTQSDTVNSPERTFFSFDCFIENNEIRMFAPSNALFKLSLYLILPIFLLIVVSIGLLLYRVIMQVYKPGMEHDMKRYIAISFICIVFIFHPTMTYQSLSVFQCAKIDSNDSRMMLHMDYKCFSRDHLKWIFAVGLPILILWVIGMPAIAFLILFKKREHLDQPELQKYLLILYQGLKRNTFYWELVNTFRKFVVLSFNVFLSTYDPYYKILGAIVSLIIFVRIQEKLKPYKEESNNRIEVLGMIAGILTLYCTLVFVTEEEDVDAVHIFSLLLLFAVNAFFLLHWLYNVLYYLNYKNKYFRMLMKMFSLALCKNSAKFSEEIEGKRLIIGPGKKTKKAKKKKSKKKLPLKKALKRKPKNNFLQDSSLRSPAPLFKSSQKGFKSTYVHLLLGSVNRKISSNTSRFRKNSAISIHPNLKEESSDLSVFKKFGVLPLVPEEEKH
ncbi:unnamed protein product [Moneuplotes crassus]|uniref:4Fe-4S ferredoxin-type domain-containing protein n=1 Tax=Euplotes crassus TaxID=5936 RepID=A0AAD1ULT6_EUPCR|nr:unnamed protein product [Moneuplotes crassus]